jgi:hypothetical protein
MKFKLIMFVIASFLGLSEGFAQGVRLSLAPELNFPTGNASNVSGIGFGGGLKAEVAVAEKYAVTANGAYNLFIGKKYFGNRTPNIKAVPVKIGLKYYSTPDFYLEGQGGAALRQGDNSKTSFVWSGGIGTLFRTSGEGKLDFGLRYEAWSGGFNSTVNTVKSSSFGFIGLKLGYLFHL